LFTPLHKGGLSGYDDALYAHEAKQMLATGDWWTTRDNGMLNFEYPPLFIWMEALSMKVWGISDFAAKFPAALCGLATIVLTFCIARRWNKELWAAVAAGWVLMLSQYFLKYSMHAMTDVPFTFLFTLAIYLYVTSEQQSWRLLLCGAAIGLAILTRSILGVLPVAVIAAHAVWTRRRMNIATVLAASAIAVLLPAVWYFSEWRMFGDEFRVQHLSFITAKAVSQQPRSTSEVVRGLMEYPWLLFRMYWPWLPVMLLGFATAFRRMARERDKLSSLLVIWLVVVMIPLSLADAKVLRYILPVFPAFALLAAMPLSGWIARLSDRRRFAPVYWVLATVVVLIAVLQSPQVRAEEMSTLAPVVDHSTPSGERALIYTHGEPRYDYVNQLLWYSNRFSEHLPDVGALRGRLQSSHRTFIVDKASYGEIVAGSGVKVAILGETENFVCFRTL
jgi:4-amino-4-deoxy-L-arabinose transferase-like glycosyltransferase